MSVGTLEASRAALALCLTNLILVLIVTSKLVSTRAVETDRTNFGNSIHDGGSRCLTISSVIFAEPAVITGFVGSRAIVLTETTSGAHSTAGKSCAQDRVTVGTRWAWNWSVRGLLAIVARRTLATTFSRRGRVCDDCFQNAVVAS